MMTSMLPNKISTVFSSLVLAMAFVSATGCDGDEQMCTRDSQCPAGHACADGVCSPRLHQDSAPADLAKLDQGVDQIMDQLVFPDLAPPDGDAGLTCKANNNGKIEREEMIFSVPSKVKVTVGSGVVLNLLGQGTAGKRLWDLTPKATDDKTDWLEVQAVPKWAASSFKTATYASRLMGDYGFLTKTELLGVFVVKPKALVLVGGVSTTDSHTKFTYATPLETIRFPVAMGDSYTTGSNINGYTAYTIPMWMHEKYDVKVLDRGKVKLLSGFTQDTLLVSEQQEAYSLANPFLKTRTRVFIFMAECYGVIARMVADGDPGKDLQKVKAKERWKLAAP